MAPGLNGVASRARGVGSFRRLGPDEAGAVLWEWDADPDFDEPAGQQWLMLLPRKWNRQQHYSWRFDPREFGAARTAPERPEGVQRVLMEDD